MTFSELWNDFTAIDGMWLIIFIMGIVYFVQVLRGEIDPDEHKPKKEMDDQSEETKKEPVKNITVEYNPLFFFYIYWTLNVCFFGRKYFWQWVNANIDTHIVGLIVICVLWICTMIGIYFYKKFFMKEHERILTEDKVAQEKLKQKIEEYESYKRWLKNEKWRYENRIRDLELEVFKLNEEFKKKAVILKTEPKKKKPGGGSFDF